MRDRTYFTIGVQEFKLLGLVVQQKRLPMNDVFKKLEMKTRSDPYTIADRLVEKGWLKNEFVRYSETAGKARRYLKPTKLGVLTFNFLENYRLVVLQEPEKADFKTAEEAVANLVDFQKVLKKAFGA